jgi:uncharacterized protein YceK
MKRILLLLLALTMLSSCGSSRYANLKKENERLSDANGMRDVDQGQNYKYASASYTSDGNLVRNIGGSIIAKAVNRNSKGCFFYIHLDNSKEVRWGTSRKKYDAKQIGDRVFFDYIGKYRFKDNILKR